MNYEADMKIAPRFSRQAERELVLRYQAGDAEAGNVLAESMLPMAFGALARLVRKRGFAMSRDEYASHANMAVAWALANYRLEDKTRLITLVYRSARFVVDYETRGLYAMKRQQPQDPAEAIGLVRSILVDGDDSLDRQDEIEVTFSKVAQILETSSEMKRDCFWRYHLEGEKMCDLAAEYGCTRQNISQLLAGMLRKVQRGLRAQR